MKGRLESVDEGSYLASVSDLMSGLMFIFIIVIVVFALGLKEQEVKKEDEVRRLRGAAEERARLLERIKDDLTKAGIQVSIAPDQGVLRLGEGILFALGRADLDAQGQTTVLRSAQVLGEVLPCYTVAPPRSRRSDCGPSGSAGRLDALFVEGHTDNLQINGLREFKDNWELSTARAKSIFNSLVTTNPLLDEFEESRQPGGLES